MNFSFIHTADIHLGRPFSDISESDEKIRLCNRACEKAFNKIIDLAIAEKVDFLLIAGDSFDREDNDLSAKLLFIKNLKKLADNGIKSYVICGNHDPIEMYKKNNSYFNFDKKYKDMINIVGVTTTDYKQTFSPIENVLVHALSFQTDEGQNPINDLPTLTSETENCFNIGLIHCDLDKTSSKYAPISRDELRKLDYDYYALGHIHVNDIKENKIVYSGSPQGRTKKETDTHGCYLVKATDKTINSIDFLPTDFVRFKSIEIDCSDCENKIDVFDKISATVLNINENAELLLFEVTLSGVSNCYNDINNSENILKEYLENYSNNSKTEVYKIENRIIPSIDKDELLKDSGIIGIIADTITNNEEIAAGIYDNIAELHENIYKKLSLENESKHYLINSLKNEKDNIINNAKKEIEAMCSEILNR